MRLTKGTHDQLQILIYVARALPGPVPVAGIAENLGFPQPNALKLINRMVHANLLRTKRGPGGGVLLARPASAINLGTAISLLESANARNELLDWSILKFEKQSSTILETAFALFVEVLDQHTLADLISNTAAEPKAIGASAGSDTFSTKVPSPSQPSIVNS